MIERERPDALLPTLGGQTALNLAVELSESRRLGETELIGADVEAIRRAEDRLAFREAMTAAGLPVPESVVVTSLGAARRVPAARRGAPGLHAGRNRRRARVDASRAGRAHRGRSRREPDRPGARRALGRRLAGIRARGDVRRRRQLRRRLLDREPRPGRRAHGRLVDGGAAADARRRRLPAAARRSFPLRPHRRRRDRRGQRAVRGRSGQRQLRADRDEPARVPLLRARVEGDGLPDREARRAARGRLHARRAAERHHRPLERRLRARARLRGGEGAALRLREVPRRAHSARDGDARDGRVARARTHLPRSVAEGARRTRRRRRAPGDSRSAPVLRRGAGLDPSGRARARRDRRRARGEALRAPRRADRAPARARRAGGARASRPPGPSRRRLLRRRVRGADAVLLPLARAGRPGRAAERTRDRDPRLGPEPDRPGDRVRLLLHPGGARVPAARLRGGAAELEPGDRVDRLRHLRPALPRARHARARARRLRAGAAARRRRAAGRSDSAEAGARAGGCGRAAAR